MSDEHYSYKGKDVTIDYRGDDRARVTIEGKAFEFTLHEGNLPMWACDDAYFMSPDLHEAAQHLIDYWYLITDPDAAPSGGHAHEGTKAPPKRKSTRKKTSDRRRSGGHH